MVVNLNFDNCGKKKYFTQTGNKLHTAIIVLTLKFKVPLYVWSLKMTQRNAIILEKAEREQMIKLTAAKCNSMCTVGRHCE